MPSILDEAYAKWLEVNKRYWQEAERFEKSTAVPLFSKFVMPLEEKKVPSLLVIIGIALVVIGAVAYSGLPSSASSNVFTLRLLTQDGQPLHGVEVTLTAESGNASQTVVSQNGVAEFSLDLLPPAKKYLLSVEGELEPSVSIVVVRGGAVQQIVLMQKTSAAGANVFLYVENGAGRPISNAAVQYLVGGGASGQAKVSRTNASGYASLALSGNVPTSGAANTTVDVNATITASGFESATVVFPASQGAVHKVTLLEQLAGNAVNLNLLALQRSRVSTPLNATTTGTIKVDVNYLSDTGFKPVANAYVAVYNGFSKTQVGQGTTNQNGYVEFRNIPADNNFNAYAVIEADGFVTFSSDQTIFNGLAQFNATLQRANANNSVDFLVKLSDGNSSSSGSSAVSASPVRGDVYIISTQGALLASRSNVNSQVAIRGLPRSSFYVAITSPNHMRFVSPLLDPTASQQFTAVLKNANTSNSATLTISAKDFDGNAISQASINLFISNVLSPAEVRTNAFGVAVFSNVPLGLPLTVKGEKNSFVGQATLIMSGNSNQTLVLKPPSGTVALSVVDYTSNQPVSNPIVKLFYRRSVTELIEIPSNCTIAADSPSCTLSLVSGVKYVVTASLAGFHSTSTEFEATPFQHTNLRLRLFPGSFSEQASFLGFFDSENGHKLDNSESLLVGKIYSAKFAVKTNKELSASSTYGLYARLGGAGESFASNNLPAGIAFISPDFSPTSSLFYSQFANASRSYSTGSCVSSIESEGFGLYKWIYAGGDTQLAPAEYSEVVVPIAAISQGSTSLEYFTLTTFGQENNPAAVDRVVRFPADVTLGESFSLPAKKWCDARALAIPIRVEQRDNVKCNAYSCISLWLTQGENTYFQNAVLQSTQVTRQNGELNYKIIDFLQTPTKISFSPPADVLKIDPSSTAPATSVNVPENKFENTVEAFSTNGKISSIVQPRRANADLSLQFGSKIYESINLEVLAPPDPPVQLGNLGTRYEVFYDKASDTFKLLNEQNQQVDHVEMYSDALLPADAVFLYFNYSSSPCQSGENNFQHALRQDSTCFDLVSAPTQFVDNPPVGLKLLKYDASSTSCSSHSIDLNIVKEANASIAVQNACSPANGTIAVNVIVRPQIAADSQDAYKALFANVLFTSLVDEGFADSNPFNEESHSLWQVLVNRQYGVNGKVNIAGRQGYLMDQRQQIVASQPPGSTSVKSGLASGKNFKEELGVNTPPYLVSLFTDGVVDKRIKTSELQDMVEQVKTIAANTAFRRTPANCDVDYTCKLHEFPYRLFEPSKDFSFQLGAGYLGANHEHKANFEGVEGPVDSEGKATQGIYALSVDHANSEGVQRWIVKATPMSISSVDYYDGECGQDATPLIVPGALSWKGACVQTCGDGTYFGLQQGETGRMCSGDSFSVSRFWKETTFIKTIQLATQLAACLTAGCATTYACVGGWSTACISAEEAAAAACAGPQAAVACAPAQAAKEAACSPKVSFCSTSTGLAAGFAAAEGVNYLLSEPSGCDLVGDAVSTVAGGVVTYGLMEYWPPAASALAVCRNALGTYRVGIDAEAATRLIATECFGLIGTRYMALIASWINHGFFDESALADRAYIDIYGNGGERSCTDWENNIADYFVYQDCQFKSLWAREGHRETCNAAPNVNLYTRDIEVSGQSGISTEFNGEVTFKIKSQ